MSRRLSKPVFRRPLQELHEDNTEGLPAVFTESIAVLRQQGLQLRDLFRGKAKQRKVQLLERAWDQGRNPLRLAHVQDGLAVGDCLLLWLQSLPAPVIPCKLFRSFLSIQHSSSQAEAISHLHYLFQQMVTCELQLLAQLMQLLNEYQTAQRGHGFLCPTLGQIFGPVLLRAQEGPLPLPLPEDTRAAANLVDCMITDFVVIFHPPQQSSSPAAAKPPSRARRQTPAKHEAANEVSSPARNAPSVASVDKFAARLPAVIRESWPGKHLRVVVVPPYEDAEVCFMDTEDSCYSQATACTLTGHRGFLSSCEAPSKEHPKLATVPEGAPLAPGVRNKDDELDSLVGALLCGSMESMLFDDSAFLARTGSRSWPGSHGCSVSQSGESTDMSELDEEVTDVSESPLSSPTQYAALGHEETRSPLFTYNTELREWLTAGR